MLALRWHGRRDVRLDDVELPEDLAPGMVEVEVAWCGICGTDVAEYAYGPLLIRGDAHPLTGRRPPLTLGHELSGRITALGPDVEGLAPGDRVAAEVLWRCGACAACRSGHYNRCRYGASIGLQSDGAFAARIRFPAYCAVPLPDGVSDEAGALLEPLAVGLHALERASAAAGELVIVLGFGPLGAATAEVARASGLTVLVAEVHAGRRARAEALGYELLDAGLEPRAIRRRTRGGADAVVECTGAAEVLTVAPELVRPGGVVVAAGLPKTPVAIDVARLVLHERSIVATLAYTGELRRVAAMVDAGTLDAERLITRRVALAEAAGELERLAADPGGDVKVLVRPGPP